MLYEFISPTKPTKLCFDIDRYSEFISPCKINEVWEKLILYTIGYYELSIKIYECIYCFQLHTGALRENKVKKNAKKFLPYVHDYNSWISVAFRMVEAGLHYECFRVVSSQDTTKFNDDECLKKWKNIVLSCGEKQKDISRIMYFMKHIAINVLHESIYDLFDKKTMLVCMGEKMVVKKEYSQYAIDTLNHFLALLLQLK